MARYTTCLECGSVQVTQTSSADVTALSCDECGHSESAANGPQIERGLVYFDDFEVMTEGEVREMRAE